MKNKVDNSGHAAHKATDCQNFPMNLRDLAENRSLCRCHRKHKGLGVERSALPRFALQPYFSRERKAQAGVPVPPSDDTATPGCAGKKASAEVPVLPAREDRRRMRK